MIKAGDFTPSISNSYPDEEGQYLCLLQNARGVCYALGNYNPEDHPDLFIIHAHRHRSSDEAAHVIAWVKVEHPKIVYEQITKQQS